MSDKLVVGKLYFLSCMYSFSLDGSNLKPVDIGTLAVYLGVKEQCLPAFPNQVPFLFLFPEGNIDVLLFCDEANILRHVKRAI